MRKPLHWSIPFFLSLAAYATPLLFSPRSAAYMSVLLSGKAIGFCCLLWAGRNKVVRDWRAFSAKRWGKSKP